MENTEQLQRELSKKTIEYQHLLDIYKYDPPKNVAELFRLKRKLVLLSNEKTKLDDQLRQFTSR